MLRFEVELLTEAFEFISDQDFKSRKKILQNINRSKENQDVRLLKKLDEEIWEFRTLYLGKQFRLLAFWYKEEGHKTLVIATHGFIKKKSKVSKKEIEKAKNIRREYLKFKRK